MMNFVEKFNHQLTDKFNFFVSFQADQECNKPIRSEHGCWAAAEGRRVWFALQKSWQYEVNCFHFNHVENQSMAFWLETSLSAAFILMIAELIVIVITVPANFLK